MKVPAWFACHIDGRFFLHTCSGSRAEALGKLADALGGLDDWSKLYKLGYRIKRGVVSCDT